MARTARLAAACLLAIAIATGTTACAGAQPEPDTAASTAGAAAPAPEATPTVATIAYTMADGTTLEVDPTQPLPANVLADITAPMQAETDALPIGPQVVESGVRAPANPNELVGANMARAAAKASKATGREVIVVYRLWASMTSGGTQEWLWSTTRDTLNQPSTNDKAARVAQAQAYVAAQANAADWDVIVLG
jgi:hypothetical protein